VDGKRQSMKLDIRPGSQAGMYVVRWQRPATGRWVLVITAGQPESRKQLQLSRSVQAAGRRRDCAHQSDWRRLDITAGSGGIGDRCVSAGPSAGERRCPQAKRRTETVTGLADYSESAAALRFFWQKSLRGSALAPAPIARPDRSTAFAVACIIQSRCDCLLPAPRAQGLPTSGFAPADPDTSDLNQRRSAHRAVEAGTLGRPERENRTGRRKTSAAGCHSPVSPRLPPTPESLERG